MAEQGLDALLLTQPESITYAAGAFSGVATFWRRAGAAALLVPADPGAPLAAVVGDLQAAAFKSQSGIADVRAHSVWVETGSWEPTAIADAPDGDVASTLVTADRAAGRRERSPRPAQYDTAAALALVRDQVTERGLSRARIGLELGFVPAADLPLIQAALPHVSFHDGTRLVERLRAIKRPAEIERLRQAAQLASAGIAALTAAIEPGMDATRMTALWREGALKEARRLGIAAPGSTWAYIAVGGDGFAPGGPARSGDLIKIDVGCVIGGYSSDGGRTAVVGRASATQRAVYDALHRAFDAGLDVLRQGAPLAEVYRATAGAMWDAGFTTYNRGHFGHGVGASIWSEEWPFISADATAVAEPGMVLAFETPYYIAGLGGFIIEDQLLVTEASVEVMAPLPRRLIETAGG